MIAVLLPPPLGGTAYLPDLARVLPDHGYSTVLPQVSDDDRPPFAARYVARASLETHRLVGEQEAQDGGSRTPVALVAEGQAGPLLSAVGAAQRAAHRPVLAYVFVNAWLPQPGSPTRAEIVHRQSPAQSDDPVEEADVPSEYWTERLQTVPDWPDAPCGYLLTDPTCTHIAKLARMRGWVVREAIGATRGAGQALAELLSELHR